MTRARWVRDVGIPTACFTLLFAGPWFVLPPVGLAFVPVVILIAAPLWWWLVRGRTDELGRGAMAGVLIGPLVHLGEFVMLLYLVRRGPLRGEGEVQLLWVLPAIALLLLAFLSIGLGALIGIGIVALQRRLPPIEPPTRLTASIR